MDLSHVLPKTSEFRFNILGYKGMETETNSPDCIDKIALPENKLVQDNSSEEIYEMIPVFLIPVLIPRFQMMEIWPQAMNQMPHHKSSRWRNLRNWN